MSLLHFTAIVNQRLVFCQVFNCASSSSEAQVSISHRASYCSEAAIMFCPYPATCVTPSYPATCVPPMYHPCVQPWQPTHSSTCVQPWQPIYGPTCAPPTYPPVAVQPWGPTHPSPSCVQPWQPGPTHVHNYQYVYYPTCHTPWESDVPGYDDHRDRHRGHRNSRRSRTRSREDRRRRSRCPSPGAGEIVPRVTSMQPRAMASTPRATTSTMTTNHIAIDDGSHRHRQGPTRHHNVAPSASTSTENGCSARFN